MAILKDDTSKRRRSIAAPTQNQKSLVAPVGKRRAHSIVPGERLSILAKARRSLVPRKSILKSSSIINTEEQSSQPSNSQSSLLDESNVTETMDLTLDYRARLHDIASRKSLGRRVSFAEHAQVRLFQTPNPDNTNSTGSPQSSPIPSSSPEAGPPTLSNENDYPRSNRRSSAAYSVAGSEDMDMTSANPGAFLDSGEGSALMEEEMDLDENDMVPDVLRGSLAHRRSLSGRQPFAPIRVRDSIVFPSDDAIPSDDDDDDGDQTQSILEDDSQVQSEIENSQEGMEFTVPMGQSLKPPATENPVWLALRQVTHSGDMPHEPQASSEDDIQVADGQQGMDLNDAMARLMRARNSLGERTGDNTVDMDLTTANGNYATHADSFSSSDDDDSLNGEHGDGNETLNVSKVVGRLSLGRISRMSLGFQDSTMDESGIYGSIVPLSSSTPRQSTVPPQEKDKLTPDLPDDLPDFPETPESECAEKPRPPVFKPLTSETNVRLPPPSTTPATEKEQPLKLPLFTFIPPPPASNPTLPQPSKSPARPVSPVKPKSKPSFSAAFAPPVTKPSPKKLSAPSTPVNGSANKRRFSVMQDGAPDSGRSSPAKRPTLGPKSAIAPSPNKRSAPSPGKNSTQKNLDALSAQPRRQSGYFVKRKSLGNTLSVPTDGRGRSLTPTPSSHRDHASSGRASLGSTQPKDWVGFDENVPAPALPIIVLPTGQSQVEEARQAPVPQPISSPDAAPTPVSEISSGSAATVPLGWMPPVSDGREEGNDVQEATSKSGTEPPQTMPAEDFPSISIDQFFSVTGIKFMDELTTPRRSIHPHTGSRTIRNPADIPLSEYYPTMGIDVPQLGLFTKVSKDLEGWMARSKADFAQAEEEAAKVTPELFVEYMRADEEGQAELLHQLNFIRTNARGQAKSDWYDWKLRWIEGLHETAEQTFRDLQSDAKSLEPIMKTGEEMVSALVKEYDELLRELEHEEAEVAEIEASDLNYLNDLKDSIAEQSFEVEALRAELSEQTEQLNYLRGRLQETTISRQEETSAYAKAQHFLEMKENSTRTEVFRLRGELEALENFHQFRVTRVDENLFEYIHASRYNVSIPCKNYLPITPSVKIDRVVDTTVINKDDFPQFTNITLQAAKALVHRSNAKSCKTILQMLSGHWSCCSQLRAQLRLVSIKYPIEILPMESDGMPGFKVKAKVMIPSKKAKVFVMFNFTCDVFSKWPMSVNLLTSDVTVGYGPVEQSTIAEAVSERLSQTTATENYACLLDACIEAEQVYGQ